MRRVIDGCVRVVFGVLAAVAWAVLLGACAAVAAATALLVAGWLLG